LIYKKEATLKILDYLMVGQEKYRDTVDPNNLAWDDTYGLLKTPQAEANRLYKDALGKEKASLISLRRQLGIGNPKKQNVISGAAAIESPQNPFGGSSQGIILG
jgi:hypothetical protein